MSEIQRPLDYPPFQFLPRLLFAGYPQGYHMAAAQQEGCSGQQRQDYQQCQHPGLANPGIDGLQLFATLKGMDADLPVILMTGHGDIP
ncbi:hypothetical protein ACC739_37015, partial [Rhizobium ruizarguesonis]